MNKKEVVNKLVALSISHFNGDIADNDESNVFHRRILTRAFAVVLSKYRKPKSIVAQRAKHWRYK